MGVGVVGLVWYRQKCKKSDAKPLEMYEKTKILDEYLLFHFGAQKEILPWDFGPINGLDFPKRCVRLCMEYFNKQTDAGADLPKRALDIGCAVGRASFELSRTMDEVVGVDFSETFIHACNILKQTGSMDYNILREGDLVTKTKAVVASDIDRNKCHFEQGDACSLRETLGTFGCVLAANLICRLHTPKKFLRDLAKFVAPGGILVITSPYTFMREYTPRERWIGSFTVHGGAEYTAFDGMKKELGPWFDLLAEDNLPFLIRETARKNQWTVAHATVWKRKL